MIELKTVRQALRSRLDELDRIKPVCEHCEHFSSGKVCSLFDEVPPADFQSTPEACADWQYDGVPF